MSRTTIKLIVAALIGAATTTMALTLMPTTPTTTSVGMASPTGDPIPATPIVDDTTTTTATPISCDDMGCQAGALSPMEEKALTSTTTIPTTTTTRAVPTTIGTALVLERDTTPTTMMSTPTTSTPPPAMDPVMATTTTTLPIVPCDGTTATAHVIGGTYTNIEVYITVPTSVNYIDFVVHTPKGDVEFSAHMLNKTRTLFRSYTGDTEDVLEIGSMICR
jgi:hypothetical protein